MTLNSIYFLRTEHCSQEFLAEYEQWLIDNYNWEASKIHLLLQSIKKTASLPDDYRNFIFLILKAFVLENYKDIEFSIIPAEQQFVTPDSEVTRAFYWKFQDHCHIMPLNDNQIEELRVEFVGLDTNVPELFNSIDSLEHYTEREEWAFVAPYLAWYGLIDSIDVIPTPSETVEMEDEVARFSSAIWFDKIQEKNIILAGLGGIGSYVAFLLSRMKPKTLFLYDDDSVETVNLAGQLYGRQNIGMFKTDALSGLMQEFSNFYSAVSLNQRFTDTSEAADIMICGFDNMEARLTFFSSWVSHISHKTDEEKKHCLFIDGRLAAEELQVLCIRGDDQFNIQRYSKEFLFKDEDADETICSYKQTSYMANMIGSIIVNLFTNFVANEIVENLRDLPFFTSYAGDSMFFKTEN